MTRRGQILIIVAILIPVILLLLAVIVDAGRLFIERAQMGRAAQAAADAGISVVAEHMVTLAVARQTIFASTPSPTPPGTMTGTPAPGDVPRWLTDDDRLTLVSGTVRGTAVAEAIEFARLNGLDVIDPDTLTLEVTFPQAGYDPNDPNITTLRLLVSVQRRATVLIAGLLGRSFVELSVEGQSVIPQR